MPKINRAYTVCCDGLAPDLSLAISESLMGARVNWGKLIKQGIDGKGKAITTNAPALACSCCASLVKIQYKTET